MKARREDHRTRAWRVHSVAPDFQLLDVWRFDLGDGPADLQGFLSRFWAAAATLAGSRLARARLGIGRALRWDDHDFTLPIPGCRETSVGERLPPGERAAADAPSPLRAPVLKTAYLREDEALYEFSNDTIHGLLHVGITGPASASLAVYIKSRGLASRMYMAAIAPFRYAFVYPALIRRVESSYRINTKV